jgi:hypothetical protein
MWWFPLCNGFLSALVSYSEAFWCSSRVGLDSTHRIFYLVWCRIAQAPPGLLQQLSMCLGRLSHQGGMQVRAGIVMLSQFFLDDLWAAFFLGSLSLCCEHHVGYGKPF